MHQDIWTDVFVSVRGSVADVIQDIAGESAITNIGSNSPIVANKPPDQRIDTGDHPAVIHQQIAVPLASRIPDKVQSKIWAHKFW